MWRIKFLLPLFCTSYDQRYANTFKQLGLLHFRNINYVNSKSRQVPGREKKHRQKLIIKKKITKPRSRNNRRPELSFKKSC